jgi:hypothetical protein
MSTHADVAVRKSAAVLPRQFHLAAYIMQAARTAV